MPTILRRLASLLRRHQLERDLREEMEAHRAMVQERLEQSGLSAADAAAASRRTLGNLTLAREEAREVWLWPSLERLWQDVRYGARALLRERAFSATAIATLAIGMGATTAMVSVVGGELWRPLPFADPDRLVSIATTPAGPTSWDRVSSDELERWRSDAASFEAIAALGPSRRRVLRSRAVPELLTALQVTPNFFSTLGWSPARGRAFASADQAAAGTEGRVAVLTDATWRKHFDSDPDIIGRSVTLDEQTVEIVGVLSSSQRLEFTSEPDLYTVVARPALTAAAARTLDPVARLKAGAGAEGAHAELTAIEGRARTEPGGDQTRGIRVEALADAHTGFNWRTLYFFLGASVFVLILSCVNVANLLLARALDRDREFAIRAALGGGRAALARQLMVEGLWIAAPGTLAGVLLASWIMPVMLSWMPRSYLLRGAQSGLDMRALVFALAACGVTTVAFGLAPILFNRVDLNRTLTRTSRGISGSTAHRRARQGLVVAEIVIAFVLVFGAGLFLNSYTQLRTVPLGFDPADRLAMGIALTGQRYTSPESARQFADRLVERVRAVPGVRLAAVGSSLPLGSGLSMNYFRTDVPKPAPGEEPGGPGRAIDLDYFNALGMRVVAGRSFTAADGPGAPHVAIINQTLAGKLFRGGDPVGQEIIVRPRSSTWVREERALVVGVVQNSKDVGIHEIDMSTVYLPLAQHPPTALQLVVHTSVPVASVADQVRKAVLEVDPSLPVLNMNTMAERVSNATRSNRFHLALLGAFAGIATALAAIGLYGSLAYATRRRIPELALRHALGASTRGLFLLVIRQAASLGVVGVALGIGTTLVLARLIGDGLYLVYRQHEGLIYGVTTTDPRTLIAASVAVAAITLLAGALPARRAVAIDPAIVLRND